MEENWLPELESLGLRDFVLGAGFTPEQPLPLILEAARNGTHLPDLISDSRTRLRDLLFQHGAILFRGWRIDQAIFTRSIEAISESPLRDYELTSPRTHLGENVYTSTDYPKTEHIFLHNELSYAKSWNRLIFFCCQVCPDSGGDTPLADVRRVYERIDPELRDKFERLGYLLVRNLNQLNIPWQTAFNTSDRAEVDAYCRRQSIETEWVSGEHLRTRQIRPVSMMRQRESGPVWFNHCTFYHIETLPRVVSEYLQGAYARKDLPNNTYYGDGSEIALDEIRHLQDAYQAEERSFGWQAGDLMVLDNTLIAHGRRPFKGNRLVLTGLTELMSWPEQDRFAV